MRQGFLRDHWTRKLLDSSNLPKFEGNKLCKGPKKSRSISHIYHILEGVDVLKGGMVPLSGLNIKIINSNLRFCAMCRLHLSRSSRTTISLTKFCRIWRENMDAKKAQNFKLKPCSSSTCPQTNVKWPRDCSQISRSH